MASPEASAAPPRLLVPVLVVGSLIGVFVVLAWPAPGSGGGTSPEAPPVASPRPASRTEVEAAGVLRSWDRRRAAAWAAGDRASLAALYVPGASAGAADAAMLGEWTARGLAVDRLTTQLLAVEVVAHGPGRWVLRVRDRVTAAVAAGPGLIEALPAGAETERQVVLRRSDGTWRVASVRPVPRGSARR
jgi:hypothetical protein